jgi:hypothetical protein
MAQAGGKDVKLNVDLSNLLDTDERDDLLETVEGVTIDTLNDHLLSITKYLGEWDQKSASMSILDIDASLNLAAGAKDNEVDVKTDVSKIPAFTYDALPGKWLVYCVELDGDSSPHILLVHESCTSVDTKVHEDEHLFKDSCTLTLVDSTRLPTVKDLQKIMNGNFAVQPSSVTLYTGGDTGGGVTRVLDDKGRAVLVFMTI